MKNLLLTITLGCILMTSILNANFTSVHIQPLTAGEEIRETLAEHLGSAGTLRLDFKLDRDWQSSRGMKELAEKLITLPDLLTVHLKLDESSVNLFVEWEGDPKIMFERHFRILVPKIPGGEWIHFDLTWDADRGLVNALLNGTPFYISGATIEPFILGESDTVIIRPGAGIHVRDVRLSHAYTAPEALAESIPSERRGTMAKHMGSARLPGFDPEALKGRLLYHNAFSDPQLTRSWVLEGPGILEEADGWMRMRSARPDGPQGHFVFWCPEDFPDSFVAEWEFMLDDPVGLCIVFFAATGPEGQSIFAPEMRPREGVFGHYVYSDLHAYHISYYASTPWVPRSMANLRKNPGLHLLGNGPIEVRALEGKIYRAVLVKQGPRIRMSIDGHTIIDVTDEGQRFGNPLKGGKIGLRQMQWTEARYRNFRVYAMR